MPEDMTMAVEASKAWMPRKSRCSALGGVAQRCQWLPSSVVRRTVPSVPEGPGDAVADVVDAAEIGGGGWVLELPLGVCGRKGECGEKGRG